MLLLMGKLFVVVAAGTSSYYFLTGAYNDKVEGLMAPMVLIMVIAWFTADMFMDVFQMTCDTVIMCFITDEEIHDGVPKFADNSLKTFVDDNGALKGVDLAEHAANTTNAQTQPAYTGVTAKAT
eukprot:gene11491-24027_t